MCGRVSVVIQQGFPKPTESFGFMTLKMPDRHLLTVFCWQMTICSFTTCLFDDTGRTIVWYKQFKITDDVRKQNWDFLNRIFPDKSQFEI